MGRRVATRRGDARARQIDQQSATHRSLQGAESSAGLFELTRRETEIAGSAARAAASACTPAATVGAPPLGPEHLKQPGQRVVASLQIAAPLVGACPLQQQFPARLHQRRRKARQERLDAREDVIDITHRRREFNLAQLQLEQVYFTGAQPGRTARRSAAAAASCAQRPRHVGVLERRGLDDIGLEPQQAAVACPIERPRGGGNQRLRVGHGACPRPTVTRAAPVRPASRGCSEPKAAIAACSARSNNGTAWS
jgi:hypothetical protein